MCIPLVCYIDCRLDAGCVPMHRSLVCWISCHLVLGLPGMPVSCLAPCARPLSGFSCPAQAAGPSSTHSSVMAMGVLLPPGSCPCPVPRPSAGAQLPYLTCLPLLLQGKVTATR